MNDIHTIQPSVNGINEVGVYLKKEAEPPFAIHIQKELDELNAQWENVCKQVRTSTSRWGTSVRIAYPCCNTLSLFRRMLRSRL